MKIIANGPLLWFPLFSGLEGEEVEISAQGYHGRSMIMAVHVDGLQLRGSLLVRWENIEWVKFQQGLTRADREQERR